MSQYSTGNEQHQARRRAAQEISESKWGEKIIAGAVNPDRRRECTKSFKAFCENYMKEAFHLGWSPVHLEAIEKIEDAVDNAGNYALAMPRGSGKSTLSKAGVLWSVLTGRVRYAMFIGATANASNSALAAMKSNLQYNDVLLEDFPEICAVIRFLEGETRKAAGMRWKGEVTNLQWGQDRVIFSRTSMKSGTKSTQVALVAFWTYLRSQVTSAVGLLSFLQARSFDLNWLFATIFKIESQQQAPHKSRNGS